MAKKLTLLKADKDVDPVVLALGQQMATFTLRDNVTRLEATLVAFKKVRVFCQVLRL
jgi:translation initiation factor eIF-2B subunit delta